MCTAAIFATVPLARSFQKFIYDTVGKAFFTYVVLFAVCAGLAALLYAFVFKLKIKSASQYFWLFLCAGLYGYFTVQLRQHPEEAIHLLQFGALAYFVFNALSYKIRDWTIYITAALIVLFIGTLDEFIQWLVPQRVWDYRDIRINALAGCIFLLAVWKGIKPKRICQPVKKDSVRILVRTIAINLIFLGLCLSNTPDTVKQYTSVSGSLSWLQSEEPMTEYGYKHMDPEIGTFYSRFTLEELRETDLTRGETYARLLPALSDSTNIDTYKELLKIYTPYTNPFLFEFLIHVSRRDDEFKKFTNTQSIKSKLKAFKENQIVEKYFGNTLKHSGLVWPSEKTEYLGDTTSLRYKDYSSKTGRMITAFNRQTAQLSVLALLIAVWTVGGAWQKRLSDD